jgi:hypothetical protein
MKEMAVLDSKLIVSERADDDRGCRAAKLKEGVDDELKLDRAATLYRGPDLCVGAAISVLSKGETWYIDASDLTPDEWKWVKDYLTYEGDEDEQAY